MTTITIHEFTLTGTDEYGTTKATIKITGDSVTEYPRAVHRALAEAEALDCTGFEWDMASAEILTDAPAPTVLVKLNKS